MRDTMREGRQRAHHDAAGQTSTPSSTLASLTRERDNGTQNATGPRLEEFAARAAYEKTPKIPDISRTRTRGDGQALRRALLRNDTSSATGPVKGDFGHFQGFKDPTKTEDSQQGSLAAFRQAKRNIIAALEVRSPATSNTLLFEDKVMNDAVSPNEGDLLTLLYKHAVNKPKQHAAMRAARRADETQVEAESENLATEKLKNKRQQEMSGPPIWKREARAAEYQQALSNRSDSPNSPITRISEHLCKTDLIKGAEAELEDNHSDILQASASPASHRFDKLRNNLALRSVKSQPLGITNTQPNMPSLSGEVENSDAPLQSIKNKCKAWLIDMNEKLERAQARTRRKREREKIKKSISKLDDGRGGPVGLRVHDIQHGKQVGTAMLNPCVTDPSAQVSISPSASHRNVELRSRPPPPPPPLPPLPHGVLGQPHRLAPKTSMPMLRGVPYLEDEAVPMTRSLRSSKSASHLSTKTTSSQTPRLKKRKTTGKLFARLRIRVPNISPARYFESISGTVRSQFHQRRGSDLSIKCKGCEAEPEERPATPRTPHPERLTSTSPWAGQEGSPVTPLIPSPLNIKKRRPANDMRYMYVQQSPSMKRVQDRSDGRGLVRQNHATDMRATYKQQSPSSARVHEHNNGGDFFGQNHVAAAYRQLHSAQGYESQVFSAWSSNSSGSFDSQARETPKTPVRTQAYRAMGSSGHRPISPPDGTWWQSSTPEAQSNYGNEVDESVYEAPPYKSPREFWVKPVTAKHATTARDPQMTTNNDYDCEVDQMPRKGYNSEEFPFRL